MIPSRDPTSIVPDRVNTPIRGSQRHFVVSDSGKYDALVSDVHTNVPSPILGDPGGVLHQGVGKVDFMMVAIDSGKDKMVYAGPTMSHYEFVMKGMKRKSDSEWKKDLKAGNTPPRPDWTTGYLVPKK